MDCETLVSIVGFSSERCERHRENPERSMFSSKHLFWYNSEFFQLTPPVLQDYSRRPLLMTTGLIVNIKV